MQEERTSGLLGHLAKGSFLIITVLLICRLFCSESGAVAQRLEHMCCGVPMPDILCCVLFCVIYYVMAEFVFQLFSPFLHNRAVLLFFAGTDILLAIVLALCLQAVGCLSLFKDVCTTGLMGRNCYILIAAVVALVVVSQKLYMMLTQYIAQTETLELHLLKRQLDPHFLFNNLGFVCDQIDENPVSAKQSLCDLSLAYRYILSHSVVEKVYISEDIRFIRIYTRFITMRFPGHFRFRIDPNLDKDMNYIMPYVIQMLVENAVKHNKHSVEKPLNIEIRSDTDYIVVSNSYDPVTIIEDSYQIGLENIKRRYKLTCHQHVVVSQENERFTVKIPIIKNESFNCRR